jgi:hypothetical protein
MDNDDSNPMHRIGYGRGDDRPSHPRKTAAYSFVQGKAVELGLEEINVEPTQPMEAVETLTVKDIVHRLIERNLQAWKALPEKIRDAMMERPKDFQLIPARNPKEGDFDYNILHNGTVWRFHPTAVVWTIHDIVR